jgi:hypothetical protein
MKAKIPLLVGGAVGYVLGTRAGRERYEQIKTQAQTIWNNPKVQEKAHQGAWAAQDFAKEKAPVLKDKLGDSSSAGTSGTGPTGTSASPSYSSVDPDPLATELDPDPLGSGTDPLSSSTDPLSSTPDDRAPFPSSGGSGL